MMLFCISLLASMASCTSTMAQGRLTPWLQTYVLAWWWSTCIAVLLNLGARAFSGKPAGYGWNGIPVYQ